MGWREKRSWALCWRRLFGTIQLRAQDALPEKARQDRNAGHVSDSKALQQLMKFVEVSNPMPAGFKGTTEHKITDPTNEL